MRHLALILLTICSLAISASNSLSLPTLSGRPGDELTISVGFDCTDAPTAMEVLIPLGEHISYVSGSAILPSARSNGHTLMANAANDTLFVHIFSMSLQPLRGTSGELFTFQIHLDDEPQVWSLNPSVVASNSAGQAIAVTKTPGQVTTLAPKIEIVTPTIDYGHQPIRQTYTKTIQLKNVGTENLTVSSLVMPSADFSYDGQSRTIVPGATTSITIQYAPTQRGAYSGTLYVNSNAVNAALRANSQIKVLADPFSVNELRIGSASGVSDGTATVSVRINNMEPLCGIQFSIALPSQLEYVDGSAALSDRAAALQLVASCTNNTLTLMAYSFNNATILGDDGEVLTFQVRLNGSNGSYSLNPTGVVLSNSSSENMVSASYRGTVSIQSPRYSGGNTLSFAEAPVTERARASYSIRNTSSQPLTISGVNFVGNASEFRVVESFPLEIAGNSSKSITVVHTPTVEGEFSTIMQVYNNDPLDRMHSVTVSGKVYEPNSLSLSGENTPEGYLLHVSMNNYSNVAALQLDIHWLEGFTPRINKTARTAAHNAYVFAGEDGVYSVMILSMLNQPISGKSGEICSILFSDMAAEDYNHTTITVSNVTASNEKSAQRVVASVAPYAVEFEIEPARIEIPVTAGQWHYIAFPVEVTNDMIEYVGNGTWGYYNSARRATGVSGWQNASFPLHANQGYIFYGDQTGTLYVNIDPATLPSGDQSVALANYASFAQENANWNFVGNPYNETYNVSHITPSGMYLYIWNGIGYYYKETGRDSYELQPLEAFFVQKKSTENSINFAAASAGAAAPARAWAANSNRYIDIAAVAGGYTDYTRVVLNETASADYTVGYDLAKFFSDEAPVQLFTLDAQSVECGVQELPNGVEQIALGYTVLESGEVVISATDMDETYYLYDAETGITTDLRQSDYTFIAESGTTVNRLSLRRAPGTATDVEHVDGVNKYVNMATKVIREGHVLILRGEKMYDLRGQEVK